MTARPMPTAHPYRHGAQQDPEGHRRPHAGCARSGCQLRPGLGLPRPADRVEDRGAVPRRRPQQGRRAVVGEFRRECRSFAEHWLSVQREEFKRLGVTGDWDHPYLTMAYPAEAAIARELMTFATTGQLYRGSKPVMWSWSRRRRSPRPRSSTRTTSATRSGPPSRSSPRRRRGSARRPRRHLDHHPLDDPGQPGRRLFQKSVLRIVSCRCCASRELVSTWCSLRCC